MKYSVLFIQVLLMSLSSCSLDHLTDAPHSNSDGIWYGPSVPDPENAVYTTVFEYPSGYDWRSDSQAEDVRCMLALYAGNIPVLKLPVGKVHEVSNLPECHKIVNGRLYTVYSDSLGTVVKENGKELFRYSQCETVINMCVDGEDVHTLGTGGSNGFVYRINGKKTVERDEAVLYNHFGMNKDSVCFCFSMAVKGSSGTERRYYLVSDGKVSLVSLPPVVSTVWDMMVNDGKLCTIMEMTGMPFLTISVGAKDHKFRINESDRLLSASFIDSARPCMQVIVKGEGGPKHTLYHNLRSRMDYEEGKTLSAIFSDADSCFVAINPGTDHQGRIYRGRKSLAMPLGYGIRGVCPMLKKDSLLILGLSSVDGSSPVFWKNGVLDTLAVNGYIANMSAF